MLDIETFDASAGGNVVYKALAHPLAAEAVAALYARVVGPVALVAPADTGAALLALHPDAPRFHERYVQDVSALGRLRAGLPGLALGDLRHSSARSVLLAAFDAKRIVARLAPLLPDGATLLTLDDARIPGRLLTNPGRYLDRLNFATNHAFFREEDGLSTRLVTANYWSGYGASQVRLWLRLFDRHGTVLATWEEDAPSGAGGIVIDSAEVRARFGLPEFTGQLFLHAIGVAGHDVVKYALDTYGSGNNARSLSVTHDANAWPSDRYAGIPAPADGEQVVVWIQNSHAAPIPAGAVALDRMGAERPVTLDQPLGAYESVALDVADLLPGLRWPAQVELRCGRHVVRPRYEVTRDGRTRIAHANVERANLAADPGIVTLPAPLGRGYLLPLPILPMTDFRTWVLPTPMSEHQNDLPVRLQAFDQGGQMVADRFLGRLPRDHSVAVDIDEFLPAGALAAGGHAELIYDFRDGGQADGWLHALVRAERRDSGHMAESSFGAHIFNTAMTYRDEPQSYSGPPPGLSTRLFLKLGHDRRRSFALLIYAASAAWQPLSQTTLTLHDGGGHAVAEATLAIACSGSALLFPDQAFAAEALLAAGEGGYVLIRDTTCRLFGYHGQMDGAGGFSLDHMFGF
jgi:hypothetical protein